MSTLALILADVRRTSLSSLSRRRAEPAVPFAGKYRIIDFVLSNCVNSGMRNIGILTQYHPHSLNDHIGNGRPWDLDRRWSGSITLLPPYRRSNGSGNWYAGAADAVFQNLDFIHEHRVDTILLLPGEHVYKMDYDPLVRYHIELQADVTIAAVPLRQARGHRGGILVADGAGRVISIQDSPFWSPYPLVSMGIYVFRMEVLMQRLTQDARSYASTHDLAEDIIPRMLALGDRLYAYPYDGYWVNVDSVQAYWKANMDLLQADPPLKLQDAGWRIHTRGEERPPVSISAAACVSNSLITDGCSIQGSVANSVLSPGVRVGTGAIVRDCIIFGDCDIGSGAVVDRAILDKNVVVGANACVGNSLDYTETADLDPAIMLVSRDAHVAPEVHVDASSIVHQDLLPGVLATDLAGGQRSARQHPQAASEITLAPLQQRSRRRHKPDWFRQNKPSALPISYD